ncbi:unnamed protein product [Lactuca saligna]|uniref:SWIM-type domain-containing protein n=1 Tax=Lactuca saligna TaxID=75948 RepID=A0AA35ZMW8_LACSI|nr:unnamed protein product [Lactuca saligna]
MTPTKVIKHRSHSNFHRSIEGKSLMVQFGQAGLKPSQIKKVVNTMTTSNVVDVTSKQCADVLSEHRKQHRGKEFYGLIKHFQDKTLVDSDQYFVVDLSDDGKHETEHLRSYVSRYSDFQEVHRKWVNSETIEQFEATWEDMLLVESRRAAEEDEDFKTMNSRPVLSSLHPIEAKAGQFYTRKMFDIFKKEWIETITNLTHETLTKTTEESIYKVGQLDVDTKYWRIVTFRSLNQVSVTCSCSMYETNGILCKHSLYVMKKKHVQELPSHYIFPRWTLDARYKLGSVSIGLGELNNENGVSAYTLFCVRSNFTKLIEQARDSPSEIQKLNTILISLLDEQANRKKSVSLENTSQSSCMGVSQVDMMPQLSIRDPLGPTTTKGRSKLASRIKSSLEAPKERTCSYCQGLGHYATSCSKRKMDELLQET